MIKAIKKFVKTLEFTPAVDLTRKGLATLLMSSLQNNGINCQFLVGQGYDGASAMSGYLHGAQEYINKDFPMALYVHCSAHSLNLALANASSLPAIRNCISTIQTVGTFFRSSTQRSEVLRISIIETLPQARHSTLVALGETRWVYKHESVLRFKKLYPAIIVALEKLESSINKETAQKSCQLLSSIKDVKFFIPLIIIENIFSYTLTLCKQLQTINADLVEACNHVDDVLAILDKMRKNNNKHFSDMFSVAAIMMNKNKKEIDFPRFANRQTQPIEGLENCNILLFPNIWKLLQVLATIPMSTATPERTFSSLKRLKTYLRNSTGETRLNGLALMSIHREINVDPEEVLNRKAREFVYLHINLAKSYLMPGDIEIHFKNNCKQLKYIMADLKIFVIVVMMFVTKDSAFSCSLRSHKHGSSHPCWPSTSDSTSNSHLIPVSNTISSPSDSSFNLSSSSSSVHANGSAISSTPTLHPNTSSLGSIPFIPTTPSAPTDNMNILNSLIQLLSSPAFSTLHSGKTQTSDKLILTSPSTSNASQSSASVSKPHTTSLPCAPVSTSSSSNILSASPPCGTASSILNTVQISKLPYSESTPSSGTNPDFTNILTKVSSLVPSLPYLSTSKPTPLLLSYPLFTPTLNKNVVPGKKPCAILSHPVGPSLNVLPGVLHSSSSSSNRPVPVPVSEKSPALTPAPVLQHKPEIVPEEFPAPSNVPDSIPVVTSTSTSTSLSSFNPASINLLHKLLVASQAKTGSSLIPNKTYVIHTLNATSISDPDIKPHIISSACGTSSESSSSCSSSILHNQSNGSISHLQHILMSMTPPPASGISFGYNPEFMKLLIKNLLFNQTSTLPSLSSLLQTKLNTTTIIPLILNPTTTSTTSIPLSELNSNVFNMSSNNTFDSSPANSGTNKNISISNDQFLPNILTNHLTSSNVSKSFLLPCLPSTNSHSISTLNSTLVSSGPCISPFGSLSDILSKFSSLTPRLNPSFPGLIPSPIIKSLPNIKPFSEQVQNLTPVPIQTPTSYPSSPTSNINLCRSKHKGPLQLSSSTSIAVDPCFQNVIRPHTPHTPPCSLSHTKLSSGCKHDLGVVISDKGDADDTASEVDAEAKSAAGMVFDTVDGATKVESGTLIGAEAGTLADPESDVCTAELVDKLSARSVNEFGWAVGAVSGTMAMAGGGLVTCAGGAGDKDGSKRSEGTAGVNKSEPGPETDDKIMVLTVVECRRPWFTRLEALCRACKVLLPWLDKIHYIYKSKLENDSDTPIDKLLNKVKIIMGTSEVQFHVWCALNLLTKNEFLPTLTHIISMKTTDINEQEWDVEKGLPRGIAAGLSGDDDDDDDDDDRYRSSGGNPNTRRANNCFDNADTEVVDGVHGKRQQRLVGGDSKSTSGGSGRARGAVCAAVKVIVAVVVFTVTCAFVWYTMGLPFLLQVVVIATIAFIASGGYKLVYLVYRTAPRDLRALCRYYYFLYTAKKLGKNNWTVADVFKHRVVKNTPHKVLFAFEDKEWTALQVEEYSNKVANVMLEKGFKKGDVVGLLMENRPEFVCIWLGMSKVGIVSALINYNQRMVSLLHSIKVANCTSLIYGAELSSDIDDIKSDLDNDIKLFKFSSTPSPTNDGTYLNHFLDKASPSAPNPPEKPGYNDKLLYIYTSGTTGYPKAAIITNVRYIFIAGAYAYQVGLKYSDRFYTPMPLYHTAAGIMCIGQSLLYGCTTVIRKKFSASGYFQDISKYNCTAGQYIGEMCRYILATPPKADDTNHKLRIIFGNGLKPQIWKEFVSRFNVPRVAEFYGSTEGNANIANTDNTFGAIGFVSRLIPSIYPISIIRVNPETCEPIRNADGLCTRCNPGEPGVIVGKIISTNPSRQFLGYVNNEESEKKIVRDVFDKGDAAFLSGDLLVADEWGYLYFKDRTGDTFRWKGENVSTAEVEGVVSNIAGYRDCVVYGVEVPNSEGRAGMAAIVDKNNTLDVSTLSDGLQKALPSYARPLFIRKLNEVEMTGTYKLKKIDLQRDGYDIERIKDQVYYSNKGIYQELTIEAYTDIMSGKIRL
ncbi:hypothetical protein QTP88_020937 [Uroleucon formosanum]